MLYFDKYEATFKTITRNSCKCFTYLEAHTTSYVIEIERKPRKSWKMMSHLKKTTSTCSRAISHEDEQNKKVNTHSNM